MSAVRAPRTENAIGIRQATDADLHSIMSILNREIERSPYVYAEVPVGIAERRDWLARHATDGLPVLVAENGAQVVGWGSLSPYRSSSGYRYTLEASVYVDEPARGRGIAGRLLEALHGAAATRGVHAIVASIDFENAPSIALFERFGYREVGRLPEVGRKFETWRTQLLLLRMFDESNSNGMEHG